jgi:hypothetical protein
LAAAGGSRLAQRRDAGAHRKTGTARCCHCLARWARRCRTTRSTAAPARRRARCSCCIGCGLARRSAAASSDAPWTTHSGVRGWLRRCAGPTCCAIHLPPLYSATGRGVPLSGSCPRRDSCRSRGAGSRAASAGRSCGCRRIPRSARCRYGRRCTRLGIGVTMSHRHDDRMFPYARPRPQAAHNERVRQARPRLVAERDRPLESPPSGPPSASSERDPGLLQGVALLRRRSPGNRRDYLAGYDRLHLQMQSGYNRWHVYIDCRVRGGG